MGRKIPDLENKDAKYGKVKDLKKGDWTLMDGTGPTRIASAAKWIGKDKNGKDEYIIETDVGGSRTRERSADKMMMNMRVKYWRGK